MDAVWAADGEDGGLVPFFVAGDDGIGGCEESGAGHGGHVKDYFVWLGVREETCRSII